MGNASAGQPQSPAGNNTGPMKTEVVGGMNKLEAFLDEYMVTKAPFALPGGLKEFIVKVAPYLIIIFALLALPLIFAAFGLSAVLGPFAAMGGYGYGYGWGAGVIVSLATSVIVLVMELMAVPGLFKRTRKSWRLIFYASLVSLVGSILALNILSGIIGAVIGWYILFQVKSLYKN